MYKRGMLLAEEVLKIILAVIAIGVLIYLLTSLYNSGGDSKEMQFAEASLNKIVDKIELGEEQVTVYNPEGWWIFNEQNLGKLCICKDNDYSSCSEEGICLDSQFETLQEIRIKNPPLFLEINQQNKTISVKT